MNAAMKHGITLVGGLAGLCAIGAGCLTRPVEHADPDTKTNVTLLVPNQVINKIDLLFDIDNSASMGDKQQYLIQAIPDLIKGLVNPNCISTANGAVTGRSVAGVCPAGSKEEFPAVKDMHIGIVSSALGQRLSETDPTGGMGVCNPQNAQPPFNTVNAHMDDKGHLVTRSLTGTSPNLVEAMVPDAVTAGGFLYWYPTAANGMGTNGLPAGPGAITSGNTVTLQMDFTALVTGVGVFGCGIESQMESWYRFLVQPDPYADLAQDMTRSVSGQHPAQWVGVDTTIIQERHDFLRPDSLVAVVVLSDENDSEIDVRSLGGLGYFFMRTTFTPPHGTSACAANPLSPNCRSCSAGSTDPACVMAGGVQTYNASNDWGYDPNLRHVHMRQKYGLDPQYPVERYYFGLTSPRVPDRGGEYPPGANDYSGLDPKNINCSNPIYAKNLPSAMQLSATAATGVSAADAKTLCTLTPGTRTPDKVFFAHIGGVPHQLLHFTPGDPRGSTLTAADWVKILGKDPERYDYTGIDPHMYESYQPRQAITGVTFDTSGTNALSPTTATGNADPINGREWITDQPMGRSRLHVDRQYACTFPLATPRDCTLDVNGYACDCPPAPGMLSHDQTPSVCDDNNPTSQTHAKAYPTIRELLLAKMMGVQGIVSSICPEHVTDDATGSDPLYGYRPAVSAIIDRLKAALTNACLPRKLQPLQDGTVPCLILVTLPGPGSCTKPTCNGDGLKVPDPNVLNTFCKNQESNYMGPKGAPGDPALQSVCELDQLTMTTNPGDFANGSCSNSLTKGWCYVEGAAANGCSQAIVFASNSPPPGSVTTLSCIEHSIAVVGGGDGG